MKNKNSKFYLVIKLYRQNVYTSREIAIGLNLDHSVVKKWIELDYANRVLNNKSTNDLPVRINRQQGFSSWVDSIFKKEMTKKKKKQQQKQAS